MGLMSGRDVDVGIPTRGASLEGELIVPEGAVGVIVFVHGAGSSRLSPRNRQVAESLRAAGPFGTLLFDLLTPEEDEVYANRFDIPLLSRRLYDACAWVLQRPETASLPLGLFGASTGAAAALRVAVEVPRVRALVSRGGRPDLAGPALERVDVPTLLIVGGSDHVVIDLNRQALARLGPQSSIVIVPGATHLFSEPGALEQVSHLAAEWFRHYLPHPMNRQP